MIWADWRQACGGCAATCGNLIGQLIESANQQNEGCAGDRREFAESQRNRPDSGRVGGGDVRLRRGPVEFHPGDLRKRRRRPTTGRRHGEPRQVGEFVRERSHRVDGADQEVERAGQRHHPGHQRDRQPDQPAGPERRDRGRPRRRARPGLRRRRRRGPQARRAVEPRGQGDHAADQGIDPPRRRRRPAFGEGRRVAARDRRRRSRRPRPASPRSPNRRETQAESAKEVAGRHSHRSARRPNRTRRVPKKWRPAPRTGGAGVYIADLVSRFKV